MDDDNYDFDDGNEFRALDSDEDDVDDDVDENEKNNEADRDDDVDIGFRSRDFQYGASGRNRNRSRKRNREEAIYGVFGDHDENDGRDGRDGRRRSGGAATMSAAPVFVPAAKPAATSAIPPAFVAAKAPGDGGGGARREKDADSTARPSYQFAPALSSEGGGLGFAAETAEEEEGSNDDPRPSFPFAPALSFVPAGKTRVGKSQPTGVAATAAAAAPKGGLGFAPTTTAPDSNLSNSNSNNDEKEAAKIVGEDEEDEEEEEKRIEKEQQEADDRFRELLEKAKNRNQRTRPGRTPEPAPPVPAATAPSTSSAGEGLGLGSGLPSSFGGGGGLGWGGDDSRPAAKDPTVATWEKHTKGFGSKLLAKMGWEGSGGLGSNRRKFRGEAVAEAGGGDATTINNDTKDGDPPVTADAVKKGISRPVEVVVRPTNMGLGFGNFKEASQLKANRRIEAEVRGVDYDAQIAREKAEARRKRRRRNRDRYGTEDGYDDDDDDDTEDEDNATAAPRRSSAIPSTEDLLSNQSWKASRSRGRNRTRNRKGVPEIIPYEELLARQKRQTGGGGGDPMIIDMRGPPSGTPKPSGSGSGGDPVPLGEELLYNVNFVLGTYGSKLNAASHHHETTIQRNLEGLAAKIDDAEARLLDLAARRDKLTRARAVVDEVRRVTLASSSALETRDRVRGLVFELRDVFSADERRDLRFASVLAPTLLGPAMEATLEGWNPLTTSDDDRRDEARDRSVVDSFFFFDAPGGGDDDDDDEGRELCESMVRTLLVPKLRADVEAQTSPVWDPVEDAYAFLDLYEYLRAKALAFDDATVAIPTPSAIEQRGGNKDNDDDDDPNQIFPSSRSGGIEDDAAGRGRRSSSRLADHIRSELIVEALYPKLQAAVAAWKPALSPRTKELRHPLHRWILPWLPHIDHPGLLPVLLKDCKRGLRSSLSVLQRGTPSSFGSTSSSSHEAADREYVTAVVDLLRPWAGVYDARSLQALVSADRAALPRLERLLEATAAGASPSSLKSSSSDLRRLFEMHGRLRLLSDDDFLGLLEGPFLTTWAGTVHSGLREEDGDDDDNAAVLAAVESYRDRKIRVLVDPFADDDETMPPPRASRSLALARSDDRICRVFYTVARMIQIRVGGGGGFDKDDDDERTRTTEEALDRLRPEHDGFYAIRARRSLEREVRFDAGSKRSEAEARARLNLRQRRNLPDATFREVVEAFASERGVAFRPKESSSSSSAGTSASGKRIYLFGDRSIYLEGDVVFCRDVGQGGTWNPVSLDRLGGMVSSSSS